MTLPAEDVLLTSAATGWICDKCGEPIQTAADGWVQWITARDGTARQLSLVHHKPASPLGGRYGCQFDEDIVRRGDRGIVSDNSLVEFVGPDGLLYLMQMIKRGVFPLDEIFEMIKRLHVPGYEHARLHFENAIEAGILGEPSDDAFYTQEQIVRVLRFEESIRLSREADAYYEEKMDL